MQFLATKAHSPENGKRIALKHRLFFHSVLNINSLPVFHRSCFRHFDGISRGKDSKIFAMQQLEMLNLKQMQGFSGKMVQKMLQNIVIGSF